MARQHSAGPVSFLLRVMPGPAASGQVIGQLERVSTGDVVVVRDGDDLTALVCRWTLSADDRLPDFEPDLEPDLSHE